MGGSVATLVVSRVTQAQVYPLTAGSWLLPQACKWTGAGTGARGGSGKEYRQLAAACGVRDRDMGKGWECQGKLP